MLEASSVGSASRRTPEALSRARPRLHRGARNGLERRRQPLESIDAGDPARALRQLAIERGHRAREPRLGILEPDGEDARPGEREPLQFQRAGSAVAVDPGRLQHETHRIDRFPIHRERRDGITAQPSRDLAQAVAIRRHRVEPPHQDVEQALARRFGRQFGRAVRQDRAVDTFGKPAQYRAFGGKRVAKVGQRDVGGRADVADRDVLERPLGGEPHQRIDDARARIGAFGGLARRGAGVVLRFIRHGRSLSAITFPERLL